MLDTNVDKWHSPTYLKQIIDNQQNMLQNKVSGRKYFKVNDDCYKELDFYVMFIFL